MTKEELKQEAEEYLKKKNYTSGYIGYFPSAYCEQAYIDSAEPREKRIEELERKLKVETELSNRLGLAYREYEQLTKEQDEHLVELEKENAELKNQVEYWQKKAELNRFNWQLNKDQLTKAKELLKQWVQYGHVNELLEQATLSFINSEVENV